MFGCPKPFLMGAEEMRGRFPLISPSFRWGVVYYDGEMDDCRMALDSILTASIDNYVPGETQKLRKKTKFKK